MRKRVATGAEFLQRMISSILADNVIYTKQSVHEQRSQPLNTNVSRRDTIWKTSNIMPTSLGEQPAAGEFFLTFRDQILWELSIFKGVRTILNLKSQNFPPTAGFSLKYLLFCLKTNVSKPPTHPPGGYWLTAI